MAYNLTIYEKYKNENVTKTSLMRELTDWTIRNQLNRMAQGGVKLAAFKIEYNFPKDIETNGEKLIIEVYPASYPPTNIHAIIGRNGAGKTRLLKNMVEATLHENTDTAGYFCDFNNSDEHPIKKSAKEMFANVIFVGFSAFDDLPTYSQDENKIPYYRFIGLNNEQQIGLRTKALSEQFSESLYNIFSTKKIKENLWRETLNLLSYDEHFNDLEISGIRYEKNENVLKKEAENKFLALSSGHKIVLLTITQLIEIVEEKSLIILDEPETHLHPPLISTFIRALSDILMKKNGVAIIATHSPIILQEIPSTCSWKMQRSGNTVSLKRINQETFGANINSLIRDVFGREIEKTGFHQLLKKILVDENNDVEAAINKYGDNLGDEAKAMLRILGTTEEHNEENE